MSLPSSAANTKPASKKPAFTDDDGDLPGTQELLELSQCRSPETSSGEDGLLKEALASNPVPVRKEHIREVMKRPSGTDAMKRPAATDATEGNPKKASKKDAVAMKGDVSAALVGTSSGSQQGVHLHLTAEPSTSYGGFKAPCDGFKNFTFASATAEYKECKAEFYSLKSYIRYKCRATGKFKLVIGTSGPNHQSKLLQLVEHVQKKNMTKEKIVQIRAQL